MQPVRNFQEANALLAKYVPNSRTPGNYSLDRMAKLMHFLHDPQDQLKIIHVAGTSGKTSTCYYAAALLAATGKNVGLTVSPHVTEVNERVQINLVPLPENTFCAELTEFMSLMEQSRIEPSYFELLVAFAYWEFAKQQVDYAVVEVGLGGLLDGTNVISRPDKVCILTDIGLDHINILGKTLPQIAAQKAGIIQHGNVVFCHQQAEEIIEVFHERAIKQHAQLHVLKPEPAQATISFLPLFQQRNFILAESTIAYVLKRDKLSEFTHEQILQAAQIQVPARMETVVRSDKTIIMDGAHNAQKLHALRESIAAKYPGQPVAILASFVDGRSFRLESSLQELAQLGSTLIVTAFQRAAQDLPYGPVNPGDLAELAGEQGFANVEIAQTPHEAFGRLLASAEPILLITGSFYLMEDLRGEVYGA